MQPNSEHRYTLHKLVYLDDERGLLKLLQHKTFGSCSFQDCYGNTPLHLAVMLGRTRSFEHLLARGASVSVKNSLGWTPIDEAICRKNFSAALKMWPIAQHENQANTERLFFEKFLPQMPDHDIQIEWELNSWVPFVTRFLPKDKCRFRKKGNKIRIDMSLKNFEKFAWDYGNLSILLNGNNAFDEKVTLVDHDKKCYESMTNQISEVDTEQFKFEWNLILKSPVVNLDIFFDKMSCSPLSAGFFYPNTQKCDLIGDFKTKAYTLDNIVINSNCRSEHVEYSTYLNFLTNIFKEMQPALGPASVTALPNSDPVVVNEKAPPKKMVIPSWNEYISGSLTPGDISFGSNSKIKTKKIDLAFTISIAENVFFPMKACLELLELLLPNQNLQNLRKSLFDCIPLGFPICIETQVFPSVTAKLVFTSINYIHPPQVCFHQKVWSECDCSKTSDSKQFTHTHLDDELFSVPSDYTHN